MTLHRDGSVIFMDSNEKEVSEDISVTTFIKKLGYQSLSSFASQGKYVEILRNTLASDISRDFDVDQCIQEEIQSLEALLEGSAVDEHMEDEYFAALEKAIQSNL